MTHICVSKQTSIDQDGGLLYGRCQAIIWANTGISLIRTLGTNSQWNLKQNSYIFIQGNAFENTVYPKKYAHGFVVLCFVVVMQSSIMNSHEVFIHIHQGCFAGTGAIVRLPQCQWSKPDGYGKTSQCITTTKHSKAKTVCIFLGIYCIVCEIVAILTRPQCVKPPLALGCWCFSYYLTL